MNLAVGLILLFSVIFLANVVEKRGSPTVKRRFNWILILLNLPLFFLGLAFLLLPTDQLQDLQMAQSFPAFRPAGLVLLLSAVWGLLAILPEARRFLSRWIPLDPESSVHTVALILAGYLVGNSVLSLTQGGLEGLAETGQPASIIEVLASELLYASVGLAGVGLFIRRSGWKAVERIGIDRPSREHLLTSLRWVGLLVLLQWMTALAFTLLYPEQAEQLDNLNTLLLGNMDTVWEWFLLAISAAIGEEILFRGALQPVFGLWATAFLFAFAHVQYGFTLATALVFVIGVVLGLIRRRYSTTVAIFVHFSYNFILGLLALLAPYLESIAQ